MNLKRCAFLSMRDLTGFCCYDYLAVEPMRRLGWDVQEIAWDSEGVEWDGFDLVVIRSAWDYQHRWQDFLSVLETIERSSARLENSLEVVRWNVHKSYLLDMADRGVRIVPTCWVEQIDAATCDQLRQRWASDVLVVKPVVGANADHTYRLPSHAPPELLRQAMDVFRTQTAIVQPFIPAVVQEGEFSLFFFSGQYSHAVVKRPQAGDFRVQEEHGGIIAATQAGQQLRDVALAALNAVAWPLLYARVDLVRLPDGEPAVMELELIEPSLYFPYDSQAPQRFATAVQQMCG